jgi:hypothetical protein
MIFFQLALAGERDSNRSYDTLDNLSLELALNQQQDYPTSSGFSARSERHWMCREETLHCDKWHL